MSSNGQKVDNTFLSTGLPEMEEMHELKIYPNPFDNSLTLSTHLNNDSEVKIKVFDIAGKLIFSHHQKELKGQFIHLLNMGYQSLSKGTYLMEMELEDKIISKKINKE
jgi:hypothetical protein